MRGIGLLCGFLYGQEVTLIKIAIHDTPGMI